jgi:DNA-binding PadR family transcriptional regulator
LGPKGRAGPGSIYPVLKSLSRKGLVRPEEEDGRRVFHLTSTGRELVAADGESWGKPWKTRKGISDSAQDALTQEAQRLAGAVWQVSQSPDPELIQSVTQTLSQARKEIFLALADEVDTTPGSLGQATSPSEDQTDPHSTETSSAPTSE